MKQFPKWGQAFAGALIVVTVLSGSLPFLRAASDLGESKLDPDARDFLVNFIGGLRDGSKNTAKTGGSGGEGGGGEKEVKVIEDEALKRQERRNEEKAIKAEQQQNQSNNESVNTRRQTVAPSINTKDVTTRVNDAGGAAREKALEKIVKEAQKKAESSAVLGGNRSLFGGLEMLLAPKLALDVAYQEGRANEQTKITAFGSFESSARDPITGEIPRDPVATPEASDESTRTLLRPESTDIQRQGSTASGNTKRFKDGVLSQLLGVANRYTSQAGGGSFSGGSGGAQGMLSGIMGKIGGGNSDFGAFLGALTGGGGGGRSGGFWDPLEGIIQGKLGELLGGIGSRRSSGGTIGNGVSNPPIFPNNEVILATQFSTSAGEAVNANVVRPIFEPVGIANILNEFSDCPDPANPGPTECVIDDNFLTAIREGLTVRQAIDRGFLKRDAVLGFRSDGLEPTYREGYPYRSLVILRTYRVIPIGWELAAQYIKVHDSKTLGEVLDGFADENSPFLGLVDPNWVMVSPEIFCRRTGPGPDLIVNDINDGVDNNGNGDFSDDGDTPPTRSFLRSQEYCADPQTCLVKGPDGQCKYFGYCSQERRIWQLNGQSCDPIFNTCQTYLSGTGEEVSYLKNTLDFDSCRSPKSIGCKTISIQSADNKWDPNQVIYFNRNTGSCDAENIGCKQFLSPRRDEQLLQSNAMRVVTTSTPAQEKTVQDEVEWMIREAKLKGSYPSIGQGYSTRVLYLKDNALLRCEPDAVGCDRYTPTQKGDDLVVPAVVGLADQCNRSCVGLNRFRQMPTTFESTYARDTTRPAFVNEREAVDFIPANGEECVADQVGCDEFTNVDEIARGGETKEYFSGIRYCQKSHADSAVYLIEQGDDRTGYQITSHELKKAATGSTPCTQVDGNGVCTASATCVVGSSPDCRQVIGLDHTKYNVLFSQTIAVSDQCHPYRRTKIVTLSKEIQAEDCRRTKGVWNDQSGCTYNLLNTDSPTCKPLAAGCREYQASSAGNVQLLLDERFDDEAARGRWSNEGENWIWTSAGTITKGGHAKLQSTTTLNLVRSTTPPSLAVPLELGRQYMVSFWAQSTDSLPTGSAGKSNPVGADVKLSVAIQESGATPTTYSFTPDGGTVIGGVWKEYRFGPLTLDRALDVAKQPSLILTKTGGARAGKQAASVYIDNLRIQQANVFLKTGSWSGKLPDVCLAGVETAVTTDDAKDAQGKGLGDPKQVGCREYESERREERVALKSFTNLCKEEFVGCQAMINTHNSTSPNERLPIGDEPETTHIDADTIAYIIDNRKNYCPQEAKGCIAAGLQVTNDRTTLVSEYRDGAVLNDPDQYNQTLCTEEQVDCKAFQSGASLTVFKDPGDAVCDYLIQPGQTSPSWYKRRFDPTDTYEDCVTVNTKTIGSTGPVETPAWLDVVRRGETLVYLPSGTTLQTGEQRIAVSSERYKKVAWAGSCPVTANSCSELVDTRSSIATGIVLNENFIQRLQSIADGHSAGDVNDTPDLWTSVSKYQIVGNVRGVSAASQNIKIEPNRLYVVELRGNGNLHATIGQCGPEPVISIVSPDVSMDAGLDQDRKISVMEGTPPVAVPHAQPFVTLNASTAQDKKDNANVFQERVVTGRFLIRHNEDRPTTRGCTLTVTADDNDTDATNTPTTYVKNATVRPAGVYYALENTLSNEVCNGGVNTDIGCVLMNKRSVVATEASTNLITNGGFEETKIIDTTRLLPVADGVRTIPPANGGTCPQGTRLAITQLAGDDMEDAPDLLPLASTDVRFEQVVQLRRSSYVQYLDFSCVPGAGTDPDQYGLRPNAGATCPNGGEVQTKTFSYQRAGDSQETNNIPVCKYVGGSGVVETGEETIPSGWTPEAVANFAQSEGNRYGKLSVSQKIEKLLPGRYRLQATGTVTGSVETSIVIQCPARLTYSSPVVISGAYGGENPRAQIKTGDEGDEFATANGGIGQKAGAVLSSGKQATFFVEFTMLPATTPTVDCTVTATSPAFMDDIALSLVTNESLQGFEALTFDADRSGIDRLEKVITSNTQTPFRCGDSESAESVCRTNANLLVKTTPDRQCGAWLACRSALETKNAEGNTQNLCFDIARCTQFGQNGECINFAVQDQVGEVATSASIVKLRDESGYTKMGREWDVVKGEAPPGGVQPVIDLGLTLTSKRRCVAGTSPGIECTADSVCGTGGKCTPVKTYSDYGWFPVATMRQQGNVLHISNGGFEEVAGTTQPSSWKTEDPKAGAVFAPAWTKGFFQAINNPLAIQREGVNPKTGLSYLALRGENRAVTSLMLAFGNTDYVISVAVNTSSLKPPAYSQVIIEQFDGGQRKISTASACGGSQPIPTPPQLRVEAGLDWKQLNYPFQTCPNTQYLQLKLAAIYNHVEVPKNEFLKAEGSSYFDDVQMTPVLTATPNLNVTRSCRLYPTSDAPSCRFQNSTGVRFRGLEGYCLQRDPNNQEICLQWYPVDVINGDERGEAEIDYKGKAPLYYCTEMKVVETRLVQPAEVGRQITKKTGLLTGAGGSAGSLAAGKGTIADVINVIAAIFGQHKFVEKFTTGDCTSEPKINGYTTYETREKRGKIFLGLFGSKTTTVKTFCQASGAILFTSHDAQNNPKNWYEYNGTLWSIGGQTDGGAGFTEEVRAICQKLTKVVQADGENFAWVSRLTEGGLKFVPELGYDYASDAEPFGAVTPPGTGDPDNPSTWQLDFPLPITTDTGVARGGNPFACSNDGQNGLPVCQISALHGILLGTNESPRHYPTGGLEQCSDASSRLKHLFAKDYGTWEWGGSCRPRQKICRDTSRDARVSIDWLCNGGTNVGLTCTEAGDNDLDTDADACPYASCVDIATLVETGEDLICEVDSDCPQDPALCNAVMIATPVGGAVADCGLGCTETTEVYSYVCNANVDGRSMTPTQQQECQDRTFQGSRGAGNAQRVCQRIMTDPSIPQNERPERYRECVANGGQDLSYVPPPCQSSAEEGICQLPSGNSEKACQGGIKSGLDCKEDKDCRGTGEKEGYVPLATPNQCTQDWNLPNASQQCPGNVRPAIDFAYCKEANDFYAMTHPQGTQADDVFINTFAGVCVGGMRNTKKCVTRHPACPKVSVFATADEWRIAGCTGSYTPVGNKFGCPAAAVIGGVKQAITPEREYCAVAPLVKTGQLNKTTVGNSEFVNFKFTSLVDANQLPMTAYKVDWGDGETTTLSGVEIKDRPNIDNAHSLYHLYSYWDIIQKEGNGYFTGRTNVPAKPASCLDQNDPCREVTIKVQIRDKWGWCNGADQTDADDAPGEPNDDGFFGKDCQRDEAWKTIDQTIKVFRDRRPPAPIAVVAVDPDGPVSTPRTTPLVSGAACPAGTHLTVLRQVTPSPASGPQADRPLAAFWDFTKANQYPDRWDFGPETNRSQVPDQAENGNNGTAIGQASVYLMNSVPYGVSFSDNGRVSTSLNIDQSSSDSTGVTMDVLVGSEEIPNGALVSTESAGATDAWGIAIRGGRIHVQTGLDDFDTGVAAVAPLHIVAVFDPNGDNATSATAKARLYVNDRLLWSQTRLGFTNVDWPVTIGNNHGGTETYNGGIIRNVKVYPLPLTTGELGQSFVDADEAAQELRSINAPSYTIATYFTCETGEETENFRFGVLPPSQACPTGGTKVTDRSFTVVNTNLPVTLPACRYTK